MQVKSLLVVLLSISTSLLYAQNDSIWQQKPILNLSGFMDVYYVYDFNKPQGTKRQDFLFNHNRHNEFNLNLGLVKLNVDHTKYRANFGLQTGTYANDNYAAELDVLKNIFEANIGISLNKKNNIWVDAGILPSYIGFESAISIDNMTLTRSLLAESSPFFMTGAKLTVNPNDKWKIAGLLVNGWQRIQRLEGNSLLSFGTQVKYSPTQKATFNWSTFIGTDTPDTTRQMRYFNNFYGNFQFSDKFGLITGIDIGAQQRTKNSSDYNLWFSPVLISQFNINNSWRTAIRVEYYQDKTGIIIPTNTPNGFKTLGFSLNLDYSPTKNIFCRLEGRWLDSRDEIFETKSARSHNNYIIATSIAIRFAETINMRPILQ